MITKKEIDELTKHIEKEQQKKLMRRKLSTVIDLY